MGRWMRNNFDTSILLAVPFCIVLYSVGSNYIKTIPPISVEKISNITLFLIIAFIVQSVFYRHKIIKALIKLSVIRESSGISFARELLSMQYDITNGIANRRIELINKYYSMLAILKLIDNCDNFYKGINCHIGNQKSYRSDFQNAMIAAINSGITIERYFIIKNEVLNKSTLFKKLIKTMDDDYFCGIKIFFILEEEVRTISFFRDRAIRGCGLYDGNIFSYDTTTDDSNLGGPHEVTITWNKKEIKEFNPFKHLDKSALLRQYPENKKDLHRKTNFQC